jgi:hypothetical protein
MELNWPVKNVRANEVLRGAYCNVELTLPCETTTLAEPSAKELKRGPSAKQMLEDGKRIIIAPEIVRGLSDEVRSKIRAMASPRQCGRLLEADQQLEIDGEPHTLTFKGVGATTHSVRDKLLGWEERCSEEEKEIYQKVRRLLQVRRFHAFQDLGMLDLRQAVREVMMTLELEKVKARAQKSLAIFKIEAMPDADGEMREMDYFRKVNSVDAHAHPVILARAMRTNFRILDLVHLKMGEQRGLLENILKHLCARHGENKGEFLERVLGELIENELALILEGYQIGNSYWPTHARNVSCEAEEIDLEDLKKNDQPDLIANASWAAVGRALIYSVGPYIYLDKKRNFDQMVMAKIKEAVKGSNLPKTQKAAARDTLWAQWSEAENNFFQSMLRLVKEEGILS